MFKLFTSLLVIALVTHDRHTLAQTSMNCLDTEVDEVPKTIYSDLFRGQQSFTFNMLAAIQHATPNENIFFSPYSTYHVLLLAYFGARNHTEQELIRSLHLEWAKNKNHVARAYHVEKQQRYKRSKEMPLEFASADKIFFANEVKLTDCIVDLFFEEVESMDFRNSPEPSRTNINSWIANITRNELPEVLNSGDITSETQLVLANAAYFKGQWASQFDPKLTTDDVFYTNGGKQSFVPMMHKRGTYNLAIDERLGVHILEMPYLTSKEEDKDSEISMIIILPNFDKDSLEKVLEKLTPDTLEQALKESMAREIDISLPKFKFEQSLEMVPILNSMGINSIFDTKADLTGFSTETKILFGDAKHVAKIKVDEEGSTAAAATVLFSFRSARPLEPTKFECNHPFLFMIYDNKAKAILFTGIYRDPMTQK